MSSKCTGMGQRRSSGVLRRRLSEQQLERFIGVIYRPESELFSHYASTCLPQQFDALVWFDETRAVTPLGPEHGNTSGIPDTYPFGVNKRYMSRLNGPAAAVRRWSEAGHFLNAM